MPRGRPRKPRLSRMDAAVDAMLPFGFPEEKVMKHVKELLKEYGGDEGWPFIEEYSYKELIEAILRDAEGNAQEQVAEDGNHQKDERPEDNTPADIAGSSDAVAEPICPEFVSTEDGKGWKDILPDQTSGYIEETANVVSKNDEDPKVRPPSNSPIPASPSLNNIPSRQPTNSLPTRRRMPCYGWIESDEEDVDDFIFLRPASAVVGAKATLPRELSKSPSYGTKSERKRRSRWDERPDDP
ncbi:hypothetical protein Pfo_015238 [Paulownia fortunei]|nr:hypothetical protein Pfo_015238 [Paulownia fortunei]